MSKYTIGEKISALRKQQGLSQKDLADKLCVSNKTVSKWECGNGDPDIDTLKKLSVIFGVSIDYLLDNKIDGNDVVGGQTEADSAPAVLHETKSGKKRIIPIVTSAVVTAVIIFLALFLLIPRSPKITEASNYIVDEAGATVYCSVDNNVAVYSIDGFDVPMFNSWNVYKDTSLGILLSEKTVKLQEGDNTFYLVVKNYAGQQKIYTLTIRRKPLYVVTFNTNGGESVLPKTVMEGEFLEHFTPVREGYIFSCWDYDFDKAITADTVITAKWIPKDFTITYHSNNEVAETKSQDVIFDSKISLLGADAFSMKGNSLSAWNTKSDGTGVEYQTSQGFEKYGISENIDLYAQWTKNLYGLSATANFEKAGTISGSGRFEYGSKQKLTVVTNAGYSWLGWFDNNGEFISSDINIEVVISDSDISYVAKWTKNSYTVTLNVNGGNDLPRGEQILTFDTSFSLPVPTRTEAHFIGWYYNATQFTDATGASVIDWNIAEDTELQAHWNINKYDISVTLNNEKGGTIDGSGSIEFGTQVNLIAHTNDGYSFIGWFKGNDLISEDSTFTFAMPNYNLTYIAKWQANRYTITLDAENDNDSTTTEAIFDSGFTFYVPTKVGYEFEGWFTDRNGFGEQLTDELGTSLNEWSIAADTTIYAKWKVVIYSITYILNGGSVLSNADSYTIEDLDIAIINPTKAGYIFKGWITPDNHTPNNALILSAGSYGNKIYAAVWEQSTSFIKISSADEFFKIGDNLNGYYYLANDIDFDNYPLTVFGDEDTPFTGVLEGNGYCLSKLAITGSIFYANNGTIQNLEIKDSSATVSPIAQINNGIISKCKINANSNCAGIADKNNGIIEYCVVDGKVACYSRHHPNASGVSNTNNGVINSCIVHAKVSVLAGMPMTHMLAAGISVSCQGTIANCIVTGDVSATVSEAMQYVVRACRISNCNCNATNYFLDTQTLTSIRDQIHDTAGEKNGAGVSKTSEQLMKAEALGFGKYIDADNLILNNGNVWVFSDNEYPKLYWEK